MRSVGHARGSDGPRVVLDTNVAISALLFSGGRLGWLRLAWQSHRLRPLISRPAAAELIRVLEYPKFSLRPEERESLLGEYLPWCEVVHVRRAPAGLPPCRDPGDQMFLELAAVGKADFLVTGDADLLALESDFRVPIVTPEQFRQHGGMGGGSLAEPPSEWRAPARRKRKKPTTKATR
jgi:putative PIN family toxin of toxin-antitoxin system